MKYFQKNDVIFTVVIAVIELALLFLYFSFFSSVSQGRHSIGTVQPKERLVTRRQTDSFHWQNLLNGSPVYEYDTVRTAAASQASISFFDGSEIEVYENSLIKLGGLTSEQIAELESGVLSVNNTGTAEKTISVGGKTLKLSGNTQALINGSKDGGTVIEIQNGSALLQDGKNEITISQLQAVQLFDNGEISAVADLPIAALYPTANKKFVKTGKDEEVPFTFASNDVENVKLVISSDKDFKTVYKSITNFQKTDMKNVYTCQSEIPGEKVYWKLVYANGEETDAMELNVYEVENISSMTPMHNAQVIQSASDNMVKFTWNKSEDAHSYVFELSRTPEFENPEVKKTLGNTSTQVRITEEGQYYWRVTPQYQYDTIGEKTGSVQKFSVKKSDTLVPTILVFPVNNYKIKLREIAQRGLRFSWKANNLASEYTIKFYREGSSSPVESYTIDKNLIELDDLKSTMFQETGKIFWSVSYSTKDGKHSSESIRNKLNVIDTETKFQTVFPPDDYIIAESLIQNIRFTWENVSQYPSLFMLARDKDFTDIVLEQKLYINSFLGAYLKPGRYFWKVKTVDDDGTVRAYSDTKTFKIIPNLEAVHISDPPDKIIVPLLKQTVVAVNWDTVPYADYYDISVYAPNGARIVRQPFSDGSAVHIPVGNYTEGNYRITVQAFSADTMAHTKNTGLISTREFSSKEVDFIKLLAPGDNGKITGEAAFNNGVTFQWLSDPILRIGGVFQLMKSGKLLKSLPINQNGTVSVTLDHLSEGTYTWKVLGDFNGYEISSKETKRFQILPIEPLQTPRFIIDKQAALIDISYLQNKNSIYFEWTPSKFVTYYELRILNSNGQELLNKHVRTNHYTLKDLSMLSAGQFTATVKAVSKTQLKGRVTDSESDSFRFSVTLPAIIKPRSEIKEEAEYYGF